MGPTKAEPPPPSAAFVPRSVPIARVFVWFQDAMRLFKRAWTRWCLLGAVTLATKVVLELFPGLGRAAAEVIVPVVECGLLIGAARLDRGGSLDLGCAVAAFRARPAALAAIVVASLIASAVELFVAYQLAGVNLLAEPSDARLTPSVLLAVAGAATLASLPLAFVPMAALFQDAGFVQAFAASCRGFALNPGALLLFGALSLALIVVGLSIYVVGLIAVYPLLAAASYYAWKDIYAAPAEALTQWR